MVFFFGGWGGLCWVEGPGQRRHEEELAIMAERERELQKEQLELQAPPPPPPSTPSPFPSLPSFLPPPNSRAGEAPSEIGFFVSGLVSGWGLD